MENLGFAGLPGSGSNSADGTVRLWHTRNRVPIHLLRPDRPYERMDITGISGITEVQKTALRALGAVDH